MFKSFDSKGREIIGLLFETTALYDKYGNLTTVVTVGNSEWDDVFNPYVKSRYPSPEPLPTPAHFNVEGS